MIRKTEKISLERETRVILEKMSSDIKTVAEGHIFLVSKFETLEGKFETMDGRINELSVTMFKTEMNAEAIKSKVGTIDIKLDRVERELETVKQATLESSRDIKELKAGHEQRLQRLEARH